jgi:hypothetical protein
MRKQAKWMAPVMAFALVIAACGSDDDDSSTDTSATEGTEATDGTDAPAETDATDDTEAPADTDAMEETDGAEVIGVTDDTITIGLNADLSGIFAPLVTQIVDGQEAFWEIVYDNGGIDGRQVELVILDNAYDVPTHLENYDSMAGEGDDGVIMFSQSTGSPHTTATADLLV